MRVKLLHGWATPEGVHHPGAIVEVGPDQARALVAGHHAEAIDPFPAPTYETAENPPAVERAVGRRARRPR